MVTSAANVRSPSWLNCQCFVLRHKKKRPLAVIDRAPVSECLMMQQWMKNLSFSSRCNSIFTCFEASVRKLFFSKCRSCYILRRDDTRLHWIYKNDALTISRLTLALVACRETLKLISEQICNSAKVMYYTNRMSHAADKHRFCIGSRKITCDSPIDRGVEKSTLC